MTGSCILFKIYGILFECGNLKIPNNAITIIEEVFSMKKMLLKTVKILGGGGAYPA
ncbi:MAG: hypothetical protein LBC27_00325 [Spirochaetaceae bacterium]|nr:hypothetical protein [Spirochaetaceae bacterium]